MRLWREWNNCCAPVVGLVVEVGLSRFGEKVRVVWGVKRVWIYWVY